MTTHFKNVLFFILLLSTSSISYSEQVIDFDGGLPNGMSIGGAMSDAFPGYITDSQYDKSSSIVFINPTSVSSFELNPLPYEGYPFDIVLSDYQIKGIDAEGNVAFELEVDLSGYTDWETWLTVQVDNSIAITELVFGPAVTEMFPSIDNLVVGLADGVDDIDEEFVAYNCEVYGVCLDDDATNTEASAGSETETETETEKETEENSDVKPIIVDLTALERFRAKSCDDVIEIDQHIIVNLLSF